MNALTAKRALTTLTAALISHRRRPGNLDLSAPHQRR